VSLIPTPTDQSLTAGTLHVSPFEPNVGTPPTASANSLLVAGRSSTAQADSAVNRHQAAAGADRKIEQQKQTDTSTATDSTPKSSSPRLRTTLASYKLGKSKALPNAIQIVETANDQQQMTKKPQTTLEKPMVLPVEQVPISDVSDQRVANRRSVWLLSPQATTDVKHTEHTDVDQRSYAAG
jgi:hypothetical protein